jgi:hypothetical protein
MSLSTRLHGVITQETTIQIFNAVKTSELASLYNSSRCFVWVKNTVSSPKGITYTFMEFDNKVPRRIFGHKGRMENFVFHT